jgi:hypothetical protein
MREPTIFEHLGGADALRRLAEAQCRRCLTDPVLIRVFGTEGRPGRIRTRESWAGTGRCCATTPVFRSPKRSAGVSWRSSSRRPTRPSSRTMNGSGAGFASTSNGAVESRWTYRSRARTSQRGNRCRGGVGSRDGLPPKTMTGVSVCRDFSPRRSPQSRRLRSRTRWSAPAPPARLSADLAGH